MHMHYRHMYIPRVVWNTHTHTTLTHLHTNKPTHTHTTQHTYTPTHAQHCTRTHLHAHSTTHVHTHTRTNLHTHNTAHVHSPMHARLLFKAAHDNIRSLIFQHQLLTNCIIKEATTCPVKQAPPPVRLFHNHKCSVSYHQYITLHDNYCKPKYRWALLTAMVM